MNVNERIREIREERGFTQQTIAEQIFGPVRLDSISRINVKIDMRVRCRAM